MKRILLYLIAPFISLTLMSSGCDCDENNVDNHISFTFESDSTNNSKFSPNEIDTITIYKLRKNTTDKLDTLLYSPLSNYNYLSFSNLFKDTIKYTLSDYIISIKDSLYFHIKDFRIESEIKESGCEDNTKKTVVVNDELFDLTTNDVDARSSIILKKSMSKKIE